MRFKNIKSGIKILTLFVLSTSCLFADTLRIAVASNFTTALTEIAAAFQTQTGHIVKLSNASTGKLYAQVIHGAPFDLFLGADEFHADELISIGKADSRFSYVYALGKLVFISNIKPDAECRDVLYSHQLKHLAIANPMTAPYGTAAQQVLEKLVLWNSLKARLVMGENISQTLQFVASTSANAGFVAKSQLMTDTAIDYACRWDIPDAMYLPIKQKMVILKQTRSEAAALAFWRFMQSAEVAVIIRDSGYDVL